jgi:uncharacterized protein (DUF488 family)
MEIYTIGFTQTTAERFFERLADAGVARLLEVRLNNTSQLAARLGRGQGGLAAPARPA